MSLPGQTSKGRKPIRIRKVWHYLLLLMLVLAMTVPASISFTLRPAEAAYTVITQPLLFLPADGTTTNDNTPILSSGGSVVYGGCRDSNDTLGLGYYYQVAKNSNFSSPILENVLVNYLPIPALPDGTYYWHVYAFGWVHRLDDCYNPVLLNSDWSDTHSFTIDTVPPAVPGLVSPADGSATIDTTPTLDWNAASGASSYQWQLANNAGFFPVYSSGTTALTDYTFSTPVSNDLYCWRVRAVDAAGNVSNWSTVWSFLVVPVPTTLTVSPVNSYYGGTVSLSATLTTASNGTAVSGQSIAFTLNGASRGGATTNTSGVATLSGISLSGILAGTYPGAIGASFAGNDTYSASSGTAQLYIRNAVPVGAPAPRPRPLRVACSVGARNGVFGTKTFRCTPSGGATPYTFLWKFGDGNTSTAQNPTHNYDLPGRYTVSVTATDAAGRTATCSRRVIVVLPGLRR